MKHHQPVTPERQQDLPEPRGRVIVYAPCGYEPNHNWLTHVEVARRLAALKGYDFAGEYAPADHHLAPRYLVPTDTLVGVEAAGEVGIRGEDDLFGGVVPYPFVATKAITHPLVDPAAHAPSGWSRAFDDQVRDAVHAGFSAFTIDDARQAGRRLLERGTARVKPVRATGGRGQRIVRTAGELDAALRELDEAEISEYGLVLEEDLADVTTCSVGQVRVAEFVATYYGTQRLTPDNQGASVYGGSDLLIVRGGFDELLALGLPREARLAVAQARTYDTAATECFPGLIASRRNYDVAQGLDASGRRRSGVLEQSWRIGGASGAEIAALEAFRADPELRAVRASCIEIYGGSEAPSGATVFFHGVDDDVGPIVKYSLVGPHDDAS